MMSWRVFDIRTFSCIQLRAAAATARLAPPRDVLAQVLVDSRSAGASEVLARVLQLTGRGVVVGDRTAGGAMHSLQREMSIGGQRPALYGVSVTDAALVMADGAPLEKVGVTPNELILPTPAQLAAGEDPVLARATAVVSSSPGT